MRPPDCKQFALERFLTRIATRAWRALCFVVWLLGWSLAMPWVLAWLVLRLDDARQRQAALDCGRMLLGGLWWLYHGLGLVFLALGGGVALAVAAFISWLWQLSLPGQRLPTCPETGLPIARVARAA